MNKGEERYYPEAKQGLLSSLKDFFMGGMEETGADEDAYESEIEYAPKRTNFYEPEAERTAKSGRRKPAVESGNNLINIRDHYTGKHTEMVLAKPKDLEGAASVCMYIRDNNACVVSLEEVDQTMSQRIADFIGGAVYSSGGTIERVNNEIFIAAPTSVHISVDVKNEIKKSGKSFFKFAANPV